MRYKQTQTVYLVVAIGNLNGSVDFDDKAPNLFDNREDAIKHAKADKSLPYVVYQVKPVWRSIRQMVYDDMEQDAETLESNHTR